jgi:hypothetical protein
LVVAVAGWVEEVVSAEAGVRPETACPQCPQGAAS